MTQQEIWVVELDYPLVSHARALLQIDSDFVEPVYNNVPIDKDNLLSDLGIESDEDDDGANPELGAEAYG